MKSVKNGMKCVLLGLAITCSAVTIAQSASTNTAKAKSIAASDVYWSEKVRNDCCLKNRTGKLYGFSRTVKHLPHRQKKRRKKSRQH